VTRTVVLDLDDPGDVERVWQALERRRALRRIDPELRQAIARRCDTLAPSTAAPILEALEELHPEVVLEAHFRELVGDRPTLGAIRRGRERAVTGRP